jgi:hypothetical protein
MKFVFIKGSLKGKKLDTDQSIINIGSDKSNLLLIPDSGISSRHAYIEKLGGQWMVIDSNSANGVFLNGEKVEHKSNLTDYDTLKLAEVEFVVLISEEAIASVKAVEIPQEYSSENEAPQKLKRQKKKSFSKALSLATFIGVGLAACVVGQKELSQTSKVANTKIVQAEATKTVQVEAAEKIESPEVQAVPLSEKFTPEAKIEILVAAKPKPLIGDVLYAYTDKYCFSCHNEKKQKGKLRIDDSDFAISSHKAISHWREILDAINGGDMPPEDEEQPSKKELSGVIGELTNRLQKAQGKLASTGGVITMRHLNRREYKGSIADLFGAPLSTQNLPSDSPEGLDTDGSEQFFTINHQKIYYTKAIDILNSAYVSINEKRKYTAKQRFDPEVFQRKHMKRQFDQFTKGEIDIEKYRSYTQKDLVKAMQKKYPGKVGRILVPRAIRALLDENLEFGANNRIVCHFTVAPGQKYKFTVVTFGSSDEIGSLSFEGSEALKLKFDSTKKRHEASVIITGSLLLDKHRVYDKYQGSHNRGIVVYAPANGYFDYFLLEPIETEKSHFEKCFEPIISNKSVSDKQLREALIKFCDRAFRNVEPANAFIDSLIKNYRSEREIGTAPGEALKSQLATVLSSASFLYMKEYSKGLGQEIAAPDYANRLAFFMWGAPPDQKLLEAARRGELQSAGGVAKQIKEMLSSEERELALGSFFGQWFGLDRLSAAEIKAPFGEFVRKEPLHYFKYMLENNLPIERLIDSDFAVVNQQLANHYGIKGEFNGFRAVKLPANSKRGGVLTQVAFLAMGTNGGKVSPTIRGTIIRSKFLNDTPPPPPPNVPQLAVQDDGTQTVRQLVDLHKSVPQCNSCHEKIDPVGYGLENFDHLGNFREEVRLKRQPDSDRKDTHLVKIDPSGYLDTSHTFNDLEGFKAQLITQKEKLARSMFEEMLSYGIGRKLEFIDEPEIEKCLERLKKRDYRVLDMVLEVVNSKAFRSK